MMFDVELLRQAINHYGPDSQMNVAVEECSELQKEICKHFRGFNNVDHLAEEVADVAIMLQQLILIFNIGDDVSTYVRRKQARLRDRIAADEASKH